MEDPEKTWKFIAIQEFKASLNGHNSAKAHKEGSLTIKLKDGTKYKIESPWINIDGLIYGELIAKI